MTPTSMPPEPGNAGNRRKGMRRLCGSIERIAVFRALMLGDLLCAVPALRALRAGFPRAQITLVGLPWARALVERLPHCVDRFIEFPGWPGLPEVPCEVRALPDFIAQVQARHFDLALQMHGSGGIVNPLVATFGARHSAGFRGPHAWCPRGDAALYVRWPESGHEIERLLRLTDALAESGRRVVLTGGAPEAEIVNALAACMRHEAVNLCGRTSLWTLGALIEGAERVVCNDTGVSHIAAALGRPSVVVSCGADVARWAPRDAERHRVLWQPMACRPCAHAECPFEHDCARAIEVPQVLHALGLPAARPMALSD